MIWTPRVTVAAVIERDGKYLVVEEETHDGMMLNQPAGHLEDQESLIDAVKRETLEETAWKFEPKGLVSIYRWHMAPKSATYLRFSFFGQAVEHNPEQPLDQGIHRTLWLDYEELKQQPERLRSPMVLRSIEDYRRGLSFSLELLQDIQQ